MTFGDNSVNWNFIIDKVVTHFGKSTLVFRSIVGTESATRPISVTLDVREFRDMILSPIETAVVTMKFCIYII